MSSRIPQSSRVAFSIVKEIIHMGEVDIPEQFQGTGAPGDTLEFLCNVNRNNFDLPDLRDWEVKFHGGNSLLTLFHKDPQPRGILRKVVDKYGWENDRQQISFRHTISGSSPRGFKVVNEDNKIKVVNDADLSIIPYWEHNIIIGAIAAKLRRLILVHGSVDKVNRKVVYERAMAYWDLDLIGICKAIEDGLIYIDFDARTKTGRGTALRNHGTKFRIHINDIGVIYQNNQPIA